jgi:hypothetical protein
MDRAINANLPREFRTTVCLRGQSVFMSDLQMSSVLTTKTASSLNYNTNVRMLEPSLFLMGLTSKYTLVTRQQFNVGRLAW